jgi:hypothetical protein
MTIISVRERRRAYGTNQDSFEFWRYDVYRKHLTKI